ncbi:hypothetical protein MUK70_15075 [Dyadobacter chenwenxiniae]|uniref:Uncharacterized protein n=1 Tax=Dyadobacter chenwenxiniae TaxID=2906456 RepID=A0A9X1TDD3_9BACT|nr:hypothetical protein [Dyadobacter chenwenxiniae]MCF0060564.1 hypothetical protein [Dyadobacter chenwenxiniae]UON86295.1 hypothetical protein MUK70_15075 [Dyadobacter chenwenxiniae]
MTDLDNLPDPDIFANDIIENLEAGIESFKEIMWSINTDRQRSRHVESGCKHVLIAGVMQNSEAEFFK